MKTFVQYEYRDSVKAIGGENLVSAHHAIYLKERTYTVRSTGEERTTQAGWRFINKKTPGTYYLGNRELIQEGENYKVMSGRWQVGWLDKSVDGSCEYVFINNRVREKSTFRCSLVVGDPTLEVCSFSLVADVREHMNDGSYTIDLEASLINGETPAEAKRWVQEVSNDNVNYWLTNSDERGIEDENNFFSFNRGTFYYLDDFLISEEGKEQPNSNLVVSQKDLEDRDIEYLSIQFYYNNVKGTFKPFKIKLSEILSA